MFLLKTISRLGLLLSLLTLPAAVQAQFIYATNFPATDTVTILRYTGSGGTVDIPSNIAGKTVTSLGTGAFDRSPLLTSVTIPESVTSIGGGSFRACFALASVSLPNSLTGIGHQAFQYCHSLAHIAIPPGIISIEAGTFRSCSNLTRVIMGTNIISIGDEAFGECSGLTNVFIPDSIVLPVWGHVSAFDNPLSSCLFLTVGS